MSRPDVSAVGWGVTDWYQSQTWTPTLLPPRYTVPEQSLIGKKTSDHPSIGHHHPQLLDQEFERQRMEHEVMHDLQGQRMDSLANQLGYQKELISILKQEIPEHRTETAKAEARSATRVTIAVLVLGIILLLVESYTRR
ncbi:hypothetical protein L1987_15970 [Smallanthus sonchifolius]|uniref:Uncharacterized protein n=1 Tax=Smallanthus sonchifolius TaxID=185202 RepID=A0ACB9J7E3_9ASTR|nr:hypothetical protein L1987_15970 [Smallanthus sonchifolius]